MNSSDATGPQLREEILRLVARYHEVAHAPKPFVPGETKVPYAGRVYDDEEMRLGVESILQFWLTAGPFAKQFEEQMRDFFGSNAAYLVNSGSSANLVAERRLDPLLVANPVAPASIAPFTIVAICSISVSVALRS